MLAKTVRIEIKIVYRAQRIPFVTNINYLKGIFAQISASVRARAIEIFLIGTGEVWVLSLSREAASPQADRHAVRLDREYPGIW